MATNFALLGATGLVGSNILKFLLQNPTPSTILTLTRRDLDKAIPAETSQTISQVIDKDTAQWPTLFTAASAKISPPPSIFFSGLATTRGSAGSYENQYKLEHDVNIAVAQAAKEAGVRTYVLISASGADPTSMVAYNKLKGEIENDIEKIGFEKFIVVRPGLIIGDRPNESRLIESVAQGLAKGLGKLSGGMLSDSWSQSAEMIARASVKAALDEGIKGKEILFGKDIIQLGKKEEW